MYKHNVIACFIARLFLQPLALFLASWSERTAASFQPKLSQHFVVLAHTINTTLCIKTQQTFRDDFIDTQCLLWCEFHVWRPWVRELIMIKKTKNITDCNIQKQHNYHSIQMKIQYNGYFMACRIRTETLSLNINSFKMGFHKNDD